MSKLFNLAKGRTYACTTAQDTTITMIDGSGNTYTVNIYAPQGIFAAVAETARVESDTAVIRQLFYSASSSGPGVKPLTLQEGDVIDPENTTEAVSGAQVAKYVDEHPAISLVVWESTTPPTTEEAAFNTIYLVPAENPQGENVYEEWVKVKKPDDTVIMERIGTTSLHIDDEVTADSANPVSGKAVYDFTDATFDSTSAHPQAGVALNFLNPQSSGFSVAYSYTSTPTDTDAKWFTVKSTETGNYIGVSDTAGTSLLSISLEDIQNTVNEAFVAESATDIQSGGTSDYIDSRVRSVLSSRLVSRLSDEQAEKALTGVYALHEDDILPVAVTGTEVDISNVVCREDATAEIWVDVYTAAPVKVNTSWVWLEGAAPSGNLEAGKRHVFIIRNDGPIPAAGATSPTGAKVIQHHLINLAYTLEFPTA